MGVAIPRQHPAVVLRSQFNHLRALLAVALIAVAGLTVAVVILANDNGQAASTSSAKPIESINYGGSQYLNPSTVGDSQYLNPSTVGDSQYLNPSTVGDSKYLNPSTGYPASFENRIDGAREGGTADVTAAELPKVTQQRAFPGLANQARDAQGPASPSKSATKDYSLNGATGDFAPEPKAQTGSRSDGSSDDSMQLRGPGHRTN